MHSTNKSSNSNNNTTATTNQAANIRCSYNDIYDIPKPATPVNYDLPKMAIRRLTANSQLHEQQQQQQQINRLPYPSMRGDETIHEEDECYDVPRPLAAGQSSYYRNAYQQQQQQQQQNTLTPSSSNSSLLTSESLSLSFSSSNRSSLAGNMPDYDIPRRNPMPVHRQLLQQQHQQKQLQQQQQQQQQQISQSIATTIANATTTTAAAANLESTNNLKVLPLNLNSALETLAKLHSESTNVIKRLLSFVQPNWREPELLEPQLMEINLALLRLRTALQGLVEFGEGALANAQRREDSNLANKLRPLVRALRDASHLIAEANEAIETQGGWTLKHLARFADRNEKPDSLDQVIACARNLTEDVRQLASCIRSNASLLFKRELLTEQISVTAESGDWLEDYDYVSFESKDAAHKKHTVLREKILPSLKEEFDSALKTAENYALQEATPTVEKKEIVLKDKLLLRYYAGQICTHMCSLRQAIDSFLETVERNQPPKFFIAYGKFVVVSAHNLVTIGDIVHRNISKEDLREKILSCTNSLTDALRSCVNKSTKAAAHFPSVIAVQEMVDAVVDISHLAMELKTTMLQAVQLTF